jgi:hypothetical protein
VEVDFARTSATQRREERFDFGLAFAAGRFESAWRFDAGRLLLALDTTFALVAGAFATTAGFATIGGAAGFTGNATGLGAATTGVGGRGGMRELVVFRGGSGCFRGLPLFRAA